MSGAYGIFTRDELSTLGEKKQNIFCDNVGMTLIEGSAIREMIFYKSVRHPNIMRAVKQFLNGVCLHTTMEAADCTLKDWINNSGLKKRQKNSRIIFSGITQALAFMHSNGVVHGDLKPANIVISKSRAQLIDFGTVVFCDDVYQQAKTTYWYMSPEDACHHKYGPHNDIWALGLILLHYWTKTPSLKFNSQWAAKKWFTNNHAVEIDTTIPKKIQGLIARMLDFDHCTRITAVEILQEMKLPQVMGTTCNIPKSVEALEKKLIHVDNAITRTCATKLSQIVFTPWLDVYVDDLVTPLVSKRDVMHILRLMIKNLT